MDEIHDLVFRHLQNRFNLSNAEARVAVYIGLGEKAGEIAKRLHLARKTIKYHATRIYRKMGDGANHKTLIAATLEVCGGTTPLARAHAAALKEIDRLRHELDHAKGIQISLPIGRRTIERE